MFEASWMRHCRLDGGVCFRSTNNRFVGRELLRGTRDVRQTEAEAGGYTLAEIASDKKIFVACRPPKFCGRKFEPMASCHALCGIVHHRPHMERCLGDKINISDDCNLRQYDTLVIWVTIDDVPRQTLIVLVEFCSGSFGRFDNTSSSVFSRLVFADVSRCASSSSPSGHGLDLSSPKQRKRNANEHTEGSK